MIVSMTVISKRLIFYSVTNREEAKIKREIEE